MDYAVFNPSTKQLLTVVTSPKGSIPTGFVFLELDKLPQDAWRENKDQSPEEVYQGKIESGYTDVETGLVLATTTEEQNRFNCIATMLLVKEAIEDKPPSVVIHDIHGFEQEITRDDFMALASRYLGYCISIRKQ